MYFVAYRIITVSVCSVLDSLIENWELSGCQFWHHWWYQIAVITTCGATSGDEVGIVMTRFTVSVLESLQIDPQLSSTIIRSARVWGVKYGLQIIIQSIILHLDHLIKNRKFMYNSGIILYMHPANERRRYIVTSSLIGWVHTHNDPCNLHASCLG